MTQTTAISLSGLQSATLTFSRFLDTNCDTDDYLYAEVWNGTAWDRVKSWGGGGNGDDNTWHAETVDLAAYLGRTDFYNDSTLLIEFSRGGQDGFRRALGMLDPAILEGAAVFYIHVSREESWRRNVARYQEKLRHSILAHMVPRETYDFFYDVNDWEDITGSTPAGWLDVNGLRVPFVTMNNEPESTDPAVLEERYSAALARLWALRSGT